MTEVREFIIQRYSPVNWPYVTGKRPFVATGPRFKEFAIPDSLERYREHRFSKTFVQDVHSLGDEPTEVVRSAIAELLLREGIVQALWVENGRHRTDDSLRWDLAVAEVAGEISKTAPVGAWVIELLAGLADPSHFRGYVSEDGLELVPTQIPE